MIRSVALSLVVFAALAAVPGSAEASWIFGRSYYSHTPTRDVAIGERSPVGPRYSRPQGAYFRSGLRQVQSQIFTGQGSWDRVLIREGWIQHGAQF
jgi:hypothetical protein